MKKTILVDIDGTIANIEHRLPFIHNKPRDWKAFMAKAMDDIPIRDILWLVKTLHAAGCEILIVTARSEQEREDTELWLNTVAEMKGIYKKIYMRETGDYRDDSIVKKDLLDRILADGHTPYMVFDDRSRVVKMWREAGIRCLQVVDGDF